MDLIKKNWTNYDILDLNNELITCKNANYLWIKNNYQTNKECLGIKIPKLRNYAKEIQKGNYLEFLNNYFDLSNDTYFFKQLNIEINLIVGILLSGIDNTDLLNKFLINYGKISDSWVETDIIKLKINNQNKNDIFSFAVDFLNSKHTFVKRLGIIIFFNYINNQKFLENIFCELKKLKCENEYYVNMAVAWLLCECFIKHKDQTLTFIKGNHLNEFVLLKFISKCKDSLRIEKDIKDSLTKLKQEILTNKDYFFM